MVQLLYGMLGLLMAWTLFGAVVVLEELLR